MQVRLSPYQQEWAEEFHRESQKLTTLLLPQVVVFEHFGSTSVAGMWAKPVIDMMGIVNHIDLIDASAERLQSFGYEMGGEWGIPGRRLFRKGGSNRTHHLHFYAVGHPDIARHLVLRDYLRQHPAAVQDYSRYKQKLAVQYPDTREYSVAKHDFVTALERRALEWRAHGMPGL